VRPDEKLSAFVELERTIYEFAVDAVLVRLHHYLKSPAYSYISMTLPAS
jgi:hypothetical protein